MTTNIIVRDRELFIALKLYQDELQNKFLYKWLTPAAMEAMKSTLAMFQAHKQQTERNPVWDVPVEIIQTGPASFDLRPDLRNTTVLEDPHKATRKW